VKQFYAHYKSSFLQVSSSVAKGRPLRIANSRSANEFGIHLGIPYPWESLPARAIARWSAVSRPPRSVAPLCGQSLFL